MNARDVMTAAVVSVNADAPVNRIAELMVENGISAVPVVDDTGAPIGIVSDGDLITRDEEARLQRRDWWLGMLAERETLGTEFVARLAPPGRLARDIMSAPVVTIGETTDLTDVARLLSTHRIKRVPVINGGRMVGIVTRADLVRALAAEPAPPSRPAASLARVTAAPESPKAPDQAELTVQSFRSLVEHAKHEAAQRDEMARRTAEETQRNAIKNLIDHHLTDESWRSNLSRMRAAAEHGEKEFMLLRFPSDLCADGGRAVNAPEPNWPETLRGEAAEIYLRWERDLKPHGFRLNARVLDFPGGFPGDIGLFLVWGE